MSATIRTLSADAVTSFSMDESSSIENRPDDAGDGWLEQLLQVQAERGTVSFQDAATVRDALDSIFGHSRAPARFETLQSLNRLIGQLDWLINAQLNVILHHEAFQSLEAAWRGLSYTIRSVSRELQGEVRVRVWNCSKSDLMRDLDRAIEFDQGQLFHKVYSEEFGMAGGLPFGLLVANYEFTNHPEDVRLLAAIASVAAAAFAPCVTAAGPELLELESFAQLERITSLDATFDRPSYVKWKALRESEDSRFVGLAIPRILMRAPYPDTPLRRDGFIFREDTSGDPQRGFLWGNAAFAFAEVAIRAFEQSGWLASVRGIRPGEVTGGFVRSPDHYCFATESPDVAPRTCTDVVITEHQDRLLSEAGLMPLCDLKGTGDAAFYSSLSIQRARAYNTPEATQNAKISGMLHYMLCVSQFARQIKVIARNMIGGMTEVSELEQRLNKWLSKYVTFDDSATPEVKAKFPLRHARVKIKEHLERPGTYDMTVHLQPHYELDDMSAAVQLTTRLARDGRTSS